MTKTRTKRYGAVLGAALIVGAGMMLAGLWRWASPPVAGPTAVQVKLDHVPGRSEPLTLETAAGNQRLMVEIARTPAEQALGLMYRTELAPDTGMLFLHDAPREVAMWMKNTYIPLDMVFVKRDGTVHSIAANTEPHSEALISSNGPVSAVLEISGGAAAKYGLKAGDQVRHPFFTGK